MTGPTFADSSAIVKLYADEYGSEAIRALPVLVVSQLARIEVSAAIWRKHRMQELTISDATVLEGAFEADFFGSLDEDPAFLAVPVTNAILDTAARMARVHGLRAYDSVQLASARRVADVDPSCRAFAAFDKNLRNAAAAEGFTLVPACL
jgi:hypothetical protein